MLPPRVIFGVGLAVLLIISAASISLDLKARSNAAPDLRSAQQGIRRAAAGPPRRELGARL